MHASGEEHNATAMPTRLYDHRNFAANPLAAICKVAKKSYQIIGSTATVCRCASHRLP